MDESLIKLSRIAGRVPTVNDLNGFKYAWNARSRVMYALAENEDGSLEVVPVGGGSGSEYTLPVASFGTLGGIKVGNNLSIDANGVLSAAAGIFSESDPIFTDWLETFVPFSGSYTDLSNQPSLDKRFVDLTDVIPDSLVGLAGQVPVVVSEEDALNFIDVEEIETKIAQFTDLGDVPNTYIGSALKGVRVNASETALEFVDIPAAADLQALELAAPWKIGNNLYQEFVLTGTDITQINYWSDATKAVKLFTKNIAYTDGNPTTISLKDELTGKFLTTTIVYTGSTITNITKVIS